MIISFDLIDLKPNSFNLKSGTNQLFRWQNHPTDPIRRTQLDWKEISANFSSLGSFRIDVSYVCGMCIVFLSFPFSSCQLFFLPRRKSHCAHHAWGEKEKGTYEDMVLEHEKFWKFFSNFSSQPHDCPPPRFEWWKVLRDFVRWGRTRTCEQGGNAWRWLFIVIFPVPSVFIYFSVQTFFSVQFLCTQQGWGAFFGAQEEWKASQVKFIAGMEVYVWRFLIRL